MTDFVFHEAFLTAATQEFEGCDLVDQAFKRSADRKIITDSIHHMAQALEQMRYNRSEISHERLLEALESFRGTLRGFGADRKKANFLCDTVYHAIAVFRANNVPIYKQEARP